MYRLPFKAQPKPTTVPVGDEEIGILEFPKLYDLTPNERLFIKEALKDEPDAQLEAVKLARKIAATNGMPIKDMFVAVMDGDEEAIAEHIEELVIVQQKMQEVGPKRQVATVTAVIKYRTLPDWTIEETIKLQEVSPKLVTQIYEFSQKEASGWSDEPPQQLTEEDLGKSQKALSTESQIGETSTGDLENSAPTKSASTKKTLVASPAG